MKKTLSALLLCAVVLFTGCAGGETSSQSSPEPQQTAGTTSLIETSESEPEPIVTSSLPATEKAEVSSAPEESSVPPEESSVPEEPDAPDIYAELIRQFDNSYLGLPQMDKEYTFCSTGTSAEIDGTEYYGVSCYDEYEGTLYYMCDFFISEDGATVYRFYENTGEYVLLPETEAFPALDPTVQSAEEIFANANELYRLFVSSNVECDTSVSMEMDGSTYYLISDERFDTMPELLEHLGKYFSDNIINSLMDSGSVRMGGDGRMYAQDLSGAADPMYRGTEYELTLLNESAAEYIAYSTYSTAEGDERTEEYVFRLEKQFGVWRFTNFTVFGQ